MWFLDERSRKNLLSRAPEKKLGQFVVSAIVKQLLNTKLLNSWMQWVLKFKHQINCFTENGPSTKMPRRKTLLTVGWLKNSQSNACLVKSDFSTTLIIISFRGEEKYWNCLNFSLPSYQLAVQIKKLNGWAAPIPGPHQTQTHILTASACQCVVKQLWELQHQWTHPTKEKFSACTASWTNVLQGSDGFYSCYKRRSKNKQILSWDDNTWSQGMLLQWVQLFPLCSCRGKN